MTVTNLQHVGLEVPDIDRTLSFYADAGLQVRARDNMGVVRCEGRDQDQIRLMEGPRKRLHHVAFGTTEEGFAAFCRRLETAGISLEGAPNAFTDDGLWVRDPDGILVNVKVAEATPSLGGPDAAGNQPDWHTNVPGHFDRRGSRAAPERHATPRPRRLGHLLQFTPDVDRKIDFYTRQLGMRLSDRVSDDIAFMHLAGGSDHHVVALAKSPAPGLHHVSFEMGNIDEIGLNASRMLARGHRNGWGFGRHVIGSNFFHYIRDPWMGLIEFFSDIDYIPDDHVWQPKDWPHEDALYVWGPTPPEDFVTNYEIAH